MIDEFTFGIISYNQEDMILELLESIKYQIIQYGKGIVFDIVIADDASKDSSKLLISRWLDDNAQLFRRMVKVFQSENVGTVINFHNLMENITTNYFKVIAADDLFSDSNLFEFLEQCGNNELNVSVPITLEDRKVSINQSWFAKHMKYKLKKHNNIYDRRKQEIGSYFHTPTVFYVKELYDKYYKSTGVNLKYFEDDELWYSLLANNNNCIVSFKSMYVVLYRRHSQSICQSKTSQNANRFQLELKAFKKYVIKNESNIIVKLNLLLQIHQPKNKYLNIRNYYEKLSKITNIMKCNLKKRYKLEYLENQKLLQRTQLYYEEINNQAKELKRIYLNEY